MPVQLRVQALDARDLPAVTVPQPYEAYTWALINELRRDPAGFADDLAAVKNGRAGFGFPAGDPITRDLQKLIATSRYPSHYTQARATLAAASPLGPLGWDDVLATRAEGHTAWMRTHSFEHTGQDLPKKYYVAGFNTGYRGGDPDAWGYSGQFSRWGENIGYTYGLTSASRAAYAAGKFGRLGFYERAAFIDLVSYVAEVNSPNMAHLTQLLTPDTGSGGFNAIGVDTSFYEGPYEARDGLGEATLSTHRLGLTRPSGAGGFLAGLAYRDGNQNGRFDIGEGAAATITVSGPVTYTDTLDPTTTQGVYSRYLPNGTYAVTTSVDGSVVGTRTVTIANGNAWFETALPGSVAATTSSPAPTVPAGTIGVRPTISWSPVPGAAAYQVRVADLTAKRSDVVRGSHTPGTNWAPSVDLIPGHVYQVSVRSLGRDQDGAWSPAREFTVAAPQVSGLGAVVTTLRPAVSWTAVPGASGYEVRVIDVARGAAVFRTQKSTDTSWSAPADLVSGRTYRLSVRAVNATGRGDWGTPVPFRVATPTLSVPTGPAASPQFSWSSVSGATRYAVELWDTTIGRRVDRASLTGQTWTPIDGLIPGHTYRWRVRAENVLGAGLWSAWSVIPEN
jgi:hypothetical protein